MPNHDVNSAAEVKASEKENEARKSVSFQPAPGARTARNKSTKPAMRKAPLSSSMHAGRNYLPKKQQLNPVQQTQEILPQLSLLPPPNRLRSGRPKRRDEKPTALMRAWVRIDATGKSSVLHTDKLTLSAELGIQPRDFRLLESTMANQASVILCREHAIVINIAFVKVIITTDVVYVLSPESEQSIQFMSELQRRLQEPLRISKLASMLASMPALNTGGDRSFHGGKANTGVAGWRRVATDGEDAKTVQQQRQASQSQAARDAQARDLLMAQEALELPFELRVLEICLDELASDLQERGSQLQASALPAVDALAKKADRPNLDRVRRVKNTLMQLYKTTENLHEALEELLDNDKDMWEMNLGAKDAARQAETEQLLAAAAGGDDRGVSEAPALEPVHEVEGEGNGQEPTRRTSTDRPELRGTVTSLAAVHEDEVLDLPLPADMTFMAGHTSQHGGDYHGTDDTHQQPGNSYSDQQHIDDEHGSGAAGVGGSQLGYDAPHSEPLEHEEHRDGDGGDDDNDHHRDEDSDRRMQQEDDDVFGFDSSRTSEEHQVPPRYSGRGYARDGTQSDDSRHGLQGDSAAPPSYYLGVASHQQQQQGSPGQRWHQPLPEALVPAPISTTTNKQVLSRSPFRDYADSPLPWWEVRAAGNTPPDSRSQTAMEFYPVLGGGSGHGHSDGGAAGGYQGQSSGGFMPVAEDGSFRAGGMKSPFAGLTSPFHDGWVDRTSGNPSLARLSRRSIAALSVRHGSSLASSSAQSSMYDLEVSQVEQLLTSYFLAVDRVKKNLKNLSEYIEDTEEMVSSQLDAQRNRLLAYDMLFLGINAISMTVAGVGGLFAMNLFHDPDLPWTEDRNTFIELGTACLGGFLLFGCLLGYYMHTGVVQFT